MNSRMDYVRQQGIIDNDKLAATPILIVGAGSVGSYAAFTLSKMGAKRIKVVDMDKVEMHNIPNQIYRPSDVEKVKVEALSEIVEEFSETKLKVVNEKFSEASLIPGTRQIVIVAVDNMKTRQEIYAVVKNNPKVYRLIDNRVGGLALEVLTIDPMKEDERAFYEDRLFPDSESEELPCTAKGIIHSMLQAICLTCDIVRRQVMGEEQFKQYMFDFTNGIFGVHRDEDTEEEDNPEEKSFSERMGITNAENADRPLGSGGVQEALIRNAPVVTAQQGIGSSAIMEMNNNNNNMMSDVQPEPVHVFNPMGHISNSERPIRRRPDPIPEVENNSEESGESEGPF